MLRDRLYLHSAIFLFGFTGVLGELINMHETHFTWLRMVICMAAFLLWFALRGTSLRVQRSQLRTLGLTGGVLALHWIAFYGCIKADGAEMALVLFSLGPAFTALLEPVFFRRKLYTYELLLSLVAAGGVYLIMQARSASPVGVALGVASALLNAFYGIFSKKLVDQLPPDIVNFYTITAGFVLLSLALPLVPVVYEVPMLALPPTALDWLYLLILSVICTNVAYVLCLKGLQGLTPFNFLLAINLEPVYGILLALLLLPREEMPGLYFWLGAAVVISTVFANIYFQRKYHPQLT
ncbi:MAG: EamA family transporter [Bacteroidetes bacterium]|nr:EamA family transporter [Bacteroidota bacterium]